MNQQTKIRTHERITEAAVRLTASLKIEVTRGMVRSWRLRGLALDDPDKLRVQLMNSERPPRGLICMETTTSATTTATIDPELIAANPAELEKRLGELQALLLAAPDYETARTIKTKISGLKELHRAQVERGHYILATDAIQAGTQAAIASKSAWENLEDSLPPILEGLSAAKMKVIIRDYARVKCDELAAIF